MTKVADCIRGEVRGRLRQRSGQGPLQFSILVVIDGLLSLMVL